MSSIFSDPFFRRGSTLLGGEKIDTDANGPIAGREVVGQVKAFQDVKPTGDGARFSNRLVYCVAARYTGSSTTGAALAGKVVKFSATAPLTEFSADAEDGDNPIGVVDEYLSGAVRQNDICWVVVKGPTTANVATADIDAGEAVEVGTTGGSDAGTVKAASTGAVVGYQIEGADKTGVTKVRINLNTSGI